MIQNWKMKSVFLENKSLDEISEYLNEIHQNPNKISVATQFIHNFEHKFTVHVMYKESEL